MMLSWCSPPPPPRCDWNQHNPLLNFSQAAAVSWFPCSQQLHPRNKLREYDWACSSQGTSYPWITIGMLTNYCQIIVSVAELSCDQTSPLSPGNTSSTFFFFHYLFVQGLLLSLCQYLNGQIYTPLDLDAAQAQYFMDLMLSLLRLVCIYRQSEKRKCGFCFWPYLQILFSVRCTSGHTEISTPTLHTDSEEEVISFTYL